MRNFLIAAAVALACASHTPALAPMAAMAGMEMIPQGKGGGGGGGGDQPTKMDLGNDQVSNTLSKNDHSNHAIYGGVSNGQMISFGGGGMFGSSFASTGGGYSGGGGGGYGGGRGGRSRGGGGRGGGGGGRRGGNYGGGQRGRGGGGGRRRHRKRDLPPVPRDMDSPRIQFVPA